MRLAAQRLAGLWPWLITAALQVALGHAGLEVEATRALIKVTLLNPKATVRPITLEGVFAGSSSGIAEGKLMQSHPLSLCNTSEDERQESFFISIVKLESPESKVPQCLPLLEKDLVLSFKSRQLLPQSFFQLPQSATLWWCRSSSAVCKKRQNGEAMCEKQLRVKDLLRGPAVAAWWSGRNWGTCQDRGKDECSNVQRQH